jgi:hypothetical protein
LADVQFRTFAAFGSGDIHFLMALVTVGALQLPQCQRSSERCE